MIVHEIGDYLRTWWAECPDLGLRLCDTLSYLEKIFNVHDTMGIENSIASELFAGMHQGVFNTYSNPMPRD